MENVDPETNHCYAQNKFCEGDEHWVLNEHQRGASNPTGGLGKGFPES